MTLPKTFPLPFPLPNDAQATRNEIDSHPYNGWTGGGLGERHQAAVYRYLVQLAQYARSIGLDVARITNAIRQGTHNEITRTDPPALNPENQGITPRPDSADDTPGLINPCKAPPYLGPAPITEFRKLNDSVPPCTSHLGHSWYRNEDGKAHCNRCSAVDPYR